MEFVCSVVDVKKVVGLEVNTDKAKYSYMLLSRHQSAGQNRDIQIANRSTEHVA
jgi:hypothetical protein